MMILLTLFAIIAGLTNPLQSGSNAQLLKATGSPVVAGCVVYLIGFACLLATIPYFGFPLRDAAGKLSQAPWWAYIGGICNAVFLIATFVVTKQLGSATFTTLTVITATVAAILLDHYGLMGFDVRPATLGRLIGAALAIAGVICIAVF